MSKNKRKNYLAIFLPLIISVSLAVGMIISFFMSPQIEDRVIFKPGERNKLSIVLDYISKEYVDEVNIEELTDEAINSLLKNLDPHSVYIDAKEAQKMIEELEGEFSGIGIQFNIFRDTIFVVNTISGGPSEAAGIKAGDRIVKINDSLVAGVDIINSDVMDMLRGPRRTEVNIEVLRRGNKELLPFTIRRAPIALTSVETSFIIEDNIGFVKISNFSRTTYSQFLDAVNNLKSQNPDLEAVILDLRSNSGGFLTAATNIADEFLEENKLLVYTEGKARPKKEVLSTRGKNTCQDFEIVVLIDEFSASAAEIIAGAIQDNDRGFIVGRRSYGKGLVQEAISFRDGSILRITTARYYTPSGRSIQKSYEDGIEEYFLDVWNRYEQGEFLTQDSIRLNDSLIYYTVGGREVYGGGGIMPDIFVPADTSGYSNLLRVVRNNSYDYMFAIDYVDSNRKMLQKIDNLEDLISYLDRIDIMSSFYNHIRTDKEVDFDKEDLNISGLNIKSGIYAYIARQTLGEEAFYKLFYEHNKTLLKAISIINENKTLFD